MTTEEPEIETVDMTPTWEVCAHLFIVAMNNGSEEGKRNAERQIVQMGKALDEQNKKLRELNE